MITAKQKVKRRNALYFNHYGQFDKVLENMRRELGQGNKAETRSKNSVKAEKSRLCS